MDKQTCAALLNMLSFDSYDINYNEWLTTYIDRHDRHDNLYNVFLLKGLVPGHVGALVVKLHTVERFTSYDDMITFARDIHEKSTQHN